MAVVRRSPAREPVTSSCGGDQSIKSRPEGVISMNSAKLLPAATALLHACEIARNVRGSIGVFSARWLFSVTIFFSIVRARDSGAATASPTRITLDADPKVTVMTPHRS
jgi:hypothetical protein